MDGGDTEMTEVEVEVEETAPPSRSTETVIRAGNIQAVEESLSQNLNQVREIGIRATSPLAERERSLSQDQLSKLFAGAAISQRRTLEGTPILAESGRGEIVLDAVNDGSSFTCVKCGGVVSNRRREEHFAYWCSSRGFN